MSEYKEDLQDLIDIQINNGIWNYSPYLLGITNGLILAMSILNDDEPKYLKAPDEWECDKPDEYGEPVAIEEINKQIKELEK